MALIMLNDAMTAYQGLEQPDLYAHCQEQIGRARGSIGDYAGARTAYSEAEKAFLGLDDVVRAAYCLLGLARIARQEDDLDQAKRLIESAKIELEKAGARAGIAAAQHAHGEVYRILGLLDAAERHYREARETYANVGSPNTVRVEFDLSFVLIRTQRFLEAQLLLDRVISAAKQEGRAVLEMKAKVNLMTCSSHSQDWYTWDHLFEFVAAALSRTGVLDFDIADQLEASALSALSAGQGDRAIASFQLALSQWQRLQRTERMATLKQHLIEAQKLLSSWS
jgi:tetratricopeptide (TPR) repeat protein